jgi:hypothetical protein
MYPQEVFGIWAPQESIWSRWAKPVLLISQQDDTYVPDLEEKIQNVAAWPAAFGDTALIVNLPGAEAVIAGLALARRGFRPVPLFNATPGPGAYLDTAPITAALTSGASLLQEVTLPPGAPPAFLIDFDRKKGRARPGQFDNRWVVFPQDFPSAIFLKSRGIKNVVVIQPEALLLAEDLAQVLSLWKRGGLDIRTSTGDVTERVEPLNLKPVSRFSLARTAFVMFMVASLGLRRNNVGGFGAIIPTETERFG